MLRPCTLRANTQAHLVCFYSPSYPSLEPGTDVSSAKLNKFHVFIRLRLKLLRIFSAVLLVHLTRPWLPYNSSGASSGRLSFPRQREALRHSHTFESFFKRIDESNPRGQRSEKAPGTWQFSDIILVGQTAQS